jgi:putative transposase
VATPKVCSATEAARVQPESSDQAAHDAYTRLLHRLEPDPAALWQEAQGQVVLGEGLLVFDDSTLDHLYARKIEVVVRHWSGKHHAVVRGINLMPLLWTDGDRHVPCDYSIFDKQRDGLTKNDHFEAVMREAHKRGFRPRCVAFDGWYASLPNLKLLHLFDWTWLTRLKENRAVNPDGTKAVSLSQVEVGANGRILHLTGYGLIRVFRLVPTDGDTEYWATNDLQMTDLTRVKWASYAWTIEHYHRGIKQFTGVERCQARAARAQRNHIGLALRAFLRLEMHCYHTGISWFEAKTSIIREAVRAYLAKPLYTLNPTA